MARPRRIDPLIVKRAHMTAATSTSVEALRQCQAVLLPALFGATLEQTAHVLGVGRATVARLQAAFRTHGSALPPAARNWGGRRQSLLTPEEERAFLKPWLARAATGNLVVVSPIRAAWRNGLASRSNRRWCTGCWPAMAGERSLRTHAIPRANPRFRRPGKKTPRSDGHPADSGCGQGTPRSIDVSR